MNRIVRRRAAQQDLVEIFYQYLRAGRPATGRRFRDQAEATLQRLAGMPGLGARYEHDHPALAELRYLPVSRFKNYLVFYRSVVGAIEVVRVLHGARDLHRILEEEFAVGEDEAEEPGEP